MSAKNRLKNLRDEDKVRINITLRGEPAQWLRGWKRRGLVTSCSDAVIQAFRLFEERVIERDLRKAELDRLQENE